MKFAFVWTAGGPRSWNDDTLETGLGGSEAMMVLYAREFARQGHEVHCYSPTEYMTRHNVVWRHTESLEWVRQFYDVVLCWRDVAPLEMVTRARVKGVVCVDQSNAPIQKAMGWCDVVLLISEHQKMRYQVQHPIPEEKIMVTSAGVEVEAFVPRPKEPHTAIYCSTPERGLIHLARLWPRVRDVIPDATISVTSGFQLYGCTEEENERLFGNIYSHTRNVPGIVHLGAIPRQQLHELMSRTAIMAYPSTYDEQCCISALECAAAWCAIVTSDRGALSERVASGKTGYLIPGEPGIPEYDDSWVYGVVSLMKMPALCQQFGAEGRLRALAHDYSLLVPQWVERFESLGAHS